MIHRNAQSLARHSLSPFPLCAAIFAVADDDPELVAMIRGVDTDEETLRLRRAAILLGRWYMGYSLPAVGRAINRDHSSIVRGYWKARHQFDVDHAFRAATDRSWRITYGGLCALARTRLELA